jgi:hypothetical protein
MNIPDFDYTPLQENFDDICCELTYLVFHRLGDLTIEQEIEINRNITEWMKTSHTTKNVCDYEDFDFEATINEMFENNLFEGYDIKGE